jgi:hypothetical protein
MEYFIVFLCGVFVGFLGAKALAKFYHAVDRWIGNDF